MLVGFDFESFYSTEYSLTKMDPPSYILDARWETIGCAFKIEEEPSFFVDGPDVGKFLAGIDASKTTTYAFNALFDNCVASWRYGWVPARMICTMRLAAATRGAWLASGNSLKAVAKYLGIGEKGTTIESARGMHRADLKADTGLWRAYQAYAINDDELNHDILYKLLPELPSAERRIMDRVLRCAVEPRFQLDQQMIADHMKDLEREKVTMLIDAGAPVTLDMEPEVLVEQLNEFAKTLRSNAKFIEVLEAQGVDIEYKQSLTNPDIKIPAFAKTDDFMAGLQEHDDPLVQALACARLGLRSTIEESRGKRLLNIAGLGWNPSYHDGNLPIPLKYAAAHTHRFGGDWKINMQNLPAGRGTNKSKLRKGLKAPPGHKVVVADKAQIECRVNGYICGQEDLLQIFRRKGDPYGVLACGIFDLPSPPSPVAGEDVWKAWKKQFSKEHPVERFIGKGGVLGLGFGCGDDKFYNMVVRQARNLGMDVRALLKVWTPTLAAKSVRVYRAQNGAIVVAWRQLQTILETAWIGVTEAVKWGPVVIGHGYVEGPSGLKMHYANPRRDAESGELLFDYGRRTHRMYGPKFLENIVQFLARIDTMNDALRISDRTHINFALQSHDELVWIVPEAQAQAHLDIAIEEMRRCPSWAPNIPLDAEGNFGDSYGDAK